MRKPVWEEDLAWGDLAQALRCEVFLAGDQMKRLAGVLGQAPDHDLVPGAGGGEGEGHSDRRC